ncbi:threonine/homoserine/homoserine lactone efflux protein [Humibacillus xanthopallidus]|uniref:Threonine/homoserine/homoserine lactone efflux protein n=1 Tax=Humibacillus xanthopallidus TaxID=412689 RepID=A0A543PP67_9MICO|nr:LysE family translocator [Humibacillus xanthopallidus]TQN45872.1 threonine/homoserine/homoserine lactone efflux protein [Humibacillus xanthopallidus]
MAPSTGAFVVATLALLVVPGPSVAFVVTRALAHGRAAGLVSVVGLEAGLLVHVVAAALGVGALVASSGAALVLLHVGGVAYLVVLGLRHVVAAPSSSGAATAHPRRGSWALARDAFAVDLLNPQTVIFFLAFLPQFVQAGPTPPTGQLLLLGLCVVVLAFGCDAGYVLACTALVNRRASAARRRPSPGWLAGSPRAATRATGAVYLGLAAWSAFA